MRIWRFLQYLGSMRANEENTACSEWKYTFKRNSKGNQEGKCARGRGVGALLLFVVFFSFVVCCFCWFMRTFIDYTHRSRPSKKQGIQLDEGLLGDTENARTSFANNKLKPQYQTDMLIGHICVPPPKENKQRFLLKILPSWREQQKTMPLFG